MNVCGTQIRGYFLGCPPPSHVTVVTVTVTLLQLGDAPVFLRTRSLDVADGLQVLRIARRFHRRWNALRAWMARVVASWVERERAESKAAKAVGGGAWGRWLDWCSTKRLVLGDETKTR